MKVYDGALIIEHEGDKLPEVGDIYWGSAIMCPHEIGENVHISAGVKCVGQGRLVLGKGVTIAPNVTIYTSVPKLDNRVVGNKYMKELEMLVGEVRIGDNTFIGAGAVLGYDIIIGDHIVVGALSYVDRNLLTKGVYVGQPAKLVRRWEVLDDRCKR